MMGYNYMLGGYGGGMMFLSWIIFVLVAAALVLSIVALWKYINKK